MECKERKQSPSTKKQVWSEAKGLDQGQTLETLEKKTKRKLPLAYRKKKISKEIIVHKH